MKKVMISLVLVKLIIFVNISTYAQKTGMFTDKRDNHVYKTIKIGNQVWMAENFAYKAINGCCSYNNNETNVSVYGYLYDWETAKKVCPKGWRLPTKKDFENLLESFGDKGNAGKFVYSKDNDYCISFLDEIVHNVYTYITGLWLCVSLVWHWNICDVSNMLFNMR